MNIVNILQTTVSKALLDLYNQTIESSQVQVQKTRPEFEGDFTIVIFPIVKSLKKSPDLIGNEIGNYLVSQLREISTFNVIKGFLNITLSKICWIEFINDIIGNSRFGMEKKNSSDAVYMVEFSSPNTNKPLHLGHIRNNLLGFAISNILEANGHKVIKVNLVNDRGIHICKSMLAWKLWGNSETPEKSGKKGDHLVGEYYVKFEQVFKAEMEKLKMEGYTEDEARRNAPIIKKAQEMLQQWEAGEESVYQLWQMMNQWVYDGFTKTYKKLGVSFDKIYYESETYNIGRKKVLEGLEKEIFYRKEDGSVWVDLTRDGLDHKVLLRADGTTVYITQDIGTAIERVNDYRFDEMIYVVGNEQEYHFKVLALVLDKLGLSWAKNLTHLSYGMVELPTGKMKSREGTVVDADDLIDEMIETARGMSKELGKLEGYSEKEKEDIFRIIGLGALKYFILKVDPKKNMTFDPRESIDFNGNTGPFIQYTYARIRSIFRKAEELKMDMPDKISEKTELSEKEMELLKLIYDYPKIVLESGEAYNPSLIANYTYELVKLYNQFYHDYPILKEKDLSNRNFRLIISKKIEEIIFSSMTLLGIEVPERM